MMEDDTDDRKKQAFLAVTELAKNELYRQWMNKHHLARDFIRTQTTRIDEATKALKVISDILHVGQ